MVEGTRIRDLDGRIVSLEQKFVKFSEEISKRRAELATRMGVMSQQIEEIGVGMSKVDGRFEDLKQLTLGMQAGNKKGNGSTENQGRAEILSGRESGTNLTEEVIPTHHMNFIVSNVGHYNVSHVTAMMNTNIHSLVPSSHAFAH